MSTNPLFKVKVQRGKITRVSIRTGTNPGKLLFFSYIFYYINRIKVNCVTTNKYTYNNCTIRIEMNKINILVVEKIFYKALSSYFSKYFDCNTDSCIWTLEYKTSSSNVHVWNKIISFYIDTGTFSGFLIVEYNKNLFQLNFKMNYKLNNCPNIPYIYVFKKNRVLCIRLHHIYCIPYYRLHSLSSKSSHYE